MPFSRPLILASSSPQRRMLLEAAGYAFRIVAPSSTAECGVCSRETPGELVARLARQKAADVAARTTLEAGELATIVSCDTVAECRGQILGKPADREHAQRMLQWLSGQPNRVYSGLCVWPIPEGGPQVAVAQTVLRMAPLTDDQIEDYLDSEHWRDKAGAFGYQDGGDWLHIVEGSDSNVIGLPMELLAEMLADGPQRAS